MLADLPVELVNHIASYLHSEANINALSQVDRRLYHVVNPYLYHHNTQSSNSALFWAATHGKTETAKKCIIAGAKGEIGLLAADSDSTARINRRTTGRCTPLTQASRKGHAEIVKLLLDSESIDANTLDTSGRAAIHWAVDSEHLAVVDLLLTSDKVQPNVANGDGDTAFSFAVQCCVEVSEVVRLLMKSDKIDVDRQGSLGKTALSYAAETGNAELVQLLLNSKRVNPNHRDYGGLTPLLLAIKAVNLATFKVLWDSDQVDRHHKDPDGQTALHIAVNAFSERQGYDEILGLLMDSSDINVNAKDGGGSTALTQAVRQHNEAAVRLLLLCNNIDVNCRYSYTGDTPLHLAAASGDHIIFGLLLGHGNIDTNITNYNSCTALSMLYSISAPVSYRH